MAFNLKTLTTHFGYAAYKNEFARLSAGGKPQPETQLGRVTLGVKYITVDQEDGRWPPSAFVMSSRLAPCDLRMQPDETVRISNFVPEIYAAQPGMKYCGDKGHWTEKTNFSPDKNKRDGLHPYCKQCRAAYAKRKYWEAKAVEQWTK